MAIGRSINRIAANDYRFSLADQYRPTGRDQVWPERTAADLAEEEAAHAEHEAAMEVHYLNGLI